MNWIKNFDNHIGFLDFSEAERLFEIASEASKKGPCLEIGTYCGKSSLVIAEACETNDSYLITVDHHIGSEEHQPGEEYFDKNFYDEKIDTARFYFDKVLPRVEQHYKSAISGSSNLMNFKFN